MPIYRVRLVEVYKTASGKERTRSLLTDKHTAPNAESLRNKMSPAAQRLFGSDFGSKIRLIITKVK